MNDSCVCVSSTLHTSSWQENEPTLLGQGTARECMLKISKRGYLDNCNVYHWEASFWVDKQANSNVRATVQDSLHTLEHTQARPPKQNACIFPSKPGFLCCSFGSLSTFFWAHTLEPECTSFGQDDDDDDDGSVQNALARVEPTTCQCSSIPHSPSMLVVAKPH